MTSTLDPAITDAWYHPIEAAVFSVSEPLPQVVVHVRGVRAMCRSQDGCSYMPTSNDTAVLNDVQVVDFEATFTGSGFGNETGGQGLVPPVSIGSVMCLPASYSWTENEIRCTLEAKLPPGEAIVKVCDHCDRPQLTAEMIELPLQECLFQAVLHSCVHPQSCHAVLILQRE